MRGKQWSVDEERQLRQLVNEGKNFDEISMIMGKTRVAVKGKFFNLGLHTLVVAPGVGGCVAAASAAVSSLGVPVPVPVSVSAPVSSGVGGSASGVDLKLPLRLPSVEEKLKVLDAALVALEQPGLSAADVRRLHNIIVGVKVYQELFAKYVDYRGLEAEVLALRRQLASENSKGGSGAAVSR